MTPPIHHLRKRRKKEERSDDREDHDARSRSESKDPLSLNHKMIANKMRQRNHPTPTPMSLLMQQTPKHS